MTQVSPTPTRPSGPVARMLAALIRAYRWLPWPMGPSRCRFAPSCSHYGLEALAVHGAVRGTWLTIARLLRCNPFNSGGLDPVPPAPGAVMTPEAYVPREVST